MSTTSELKQILDANREQTLEIVKTILEETKKPAPPTQRQVIELEQAQQDRLATAESVKLTEENKRQFQLHICKHEHSRAAGGGTHCVWVRDNDVPQSVGYVICQKCEGRFRPQEPLMMGRPEGDEKPALEKGGYRNGLDPKAIFDTGIFNKLLQDCDASSGGEIIG